MLDVQVQSPIQNSPYDEPTRGWRVVPGQTPQLEQGRRAAAYYWRKGGGVATTTAGHAAVLALLLDAGVAVDAVYENKLTALMWAAGQGQADAVKLLLSRGADRGLKDDRGLTALEMARQGGHGAVAGLLQAP